MYSVLPPYWILFGLLSDIAIICLHITYWMLNMYHLHLSQALK